MAVRLSKFTTWVPDSVILHDDVEYPCRQISAGGLDILQAVTGGASEDVTRAELVQAVRDVLPTAPAAQVERCSIEELIAALVCASVPAQALHESLAAAEPEKKRTGSRSRSTR